jgi:hypothetical protein
MKTLIAGVFFSIIIFTSAVVPAENTKQDDPLYDMGMLMRFMDHGLCVALQGADFLMLGEQGLSKKLDRDAIVHGTIMINDGKAMIKEMLEGKAMVELYQEGNFDKQFMDELHALGQEMLKVIEDIEKLHKASIQQVSKKK